MTKIQAALQVAFDYGQIEGDHHRAWVIDQMVRALCHDEESYRGWIKSFCFGADGPATYSWYEGIVP